MPLNVRRLSASIGLVIIFVFGVLAQTPTSVDVMRSRISKAKALVAVKNYAAAIYELEGIKRETNDVTVNSVVQVMLMNCYLEQLDYKRAQALLTEIFNAQKAGKPGANYFAVAGQVVKGARNQQDRYKSLGLSVADRNLPTEAVADVEKMRETVEIVVGHSKTLGENKKLTPDSMALLEEAGNARSGLARDEYDARRWKEEVADARDKLIASRTTVINTVNDGTPNTIDVSKTVASTGGPIITMTPEPTPAKTVPSSTQTAVTTAPTPIPTPVAEKKDPVIIKTETPKTEETVAKTETPKINPETIAKNEPPKVEPQPTPKSEPIEQKIVVETPKEEPKKEDAITRDRTVNSQTTVAANTPKVEEKKTDVQPADNEAVKDSSPLQIGSLIDYATAKVNPTYPPAARTMRMTGTVKVEVIISEDGSIAEVQKTSGPPMLQRAATDALKKWKFKPFTRDGQPVKATGFVSFNFNL
jgi:periplasmic protein TonB